MLRVLTGISIYYILIPGYLIALTLTFFVPKIFTGIAFDSGRRRVRPDDNDLPAALLDGRLRSARREPC